MPRPSRLPTERGEARTRLLDAAPEIVRSKGFNATTVDDLCKVASVTKGADFHHFPSRETLGVAAAENWAATTGAILADAPCLAHSDPLDRVLAYIDYRLAIIGDDDDTAAWTSLVGTMTQEVYGSHPPIRDACVASIFDHADTLVSDIVVVIRAHNITAVWTADGLARQAQAVIQGAFILAKASGDADAARESLRHLKRYLEYLFNCPKPERISQ